MIPLEKISWPYFFLMYPNFWGEIPFPKKLNYWKRKNVLFIGDIYLLRYFP